MKLSARQYAQALYQAISEVGESDHDKVLDNFVSVLRSNRDLGMFDEVELEFRNFDREARGIKIAEVTTARELSSDEEKKLIDDLNKRVLGQVELKKKVDKGLIGGIMVKIDDELIDGSVKKQLKELKSKLIN